MFKTLDSEISLQLPINVLNKYPILAGPNGFIATCNAFLHLDSLYDTEKFSLLSCIKKVNLELQLNNSSTFPYVANVLHAINCKITRVFNNVYNRTQDVNAFKVYSEIQKQLFGDTNGKTSILADFRLLR